MKALPFQLFALVTHQTDLMLSFVGLWRSSIALWVAESSKIINTSFKSVETVDELIMASFHCP
jgi:hypothetical protein